MANLVIPRREIWTQPPDGVVRVNERFASRLKFALIPNVGLVNLSGLDTPIQTTGMDKLVGKNGVSYLGGKRSEFNPTLPNANGLTLISVWRARPTSNYLSADATRCLISNRTAGNAGWIWGRSSAVGGGATGNLTAQTYTINGIAQYAESNYAIESNVDTPVACRYSKATGKISWFRFGTRSSPDTTATTSPTVGGNIVFGASGPYIDNSQPWLDVASVVLGFVGELSDSEIYDLTKDVNSVWGAFEPRETRLFVPVGGGGSVNANASGALSAVAVTAPSASASGSASATGACAAITITAPTATASAGGSASASGSFAALSISPATATATATKSATASGAFAAISISAPTATASGTTAGGANATCTPAQITISHATAIAIGSAVASGGFQSIGITAPGATASVGNGNATASGEWSSVSITAPTGYASSGLIRAPSGSGPTVIQPGSYRPSQSATSRPGNTGGRRY